MPTIQQRKKLAQPHSCPDDVYNLLMTCWRIDPNGRPSAHDILNKLAGAINSITAALGDADTELDWPSLSTLQSKLAASGAVSSDFTSTTSTSADVSSVGLDMSIDLDSADRIAAFKALELARDSLTLMDVLGSGAFGEVRLAELAPTTGPDRTRRVAVKCLKDGSDVESKQKFVLEARTLAALQHDHIVRLLGVCMNDEPNLIVIELMKFGDLRAYLQAHSPEGDAAGRSTGTLRLRSTTDTQVVGVVALVDATWQIASAMKYLERIRIIHRDLAARSVQRETQPPLYRWGYNLIPANKNDDAVVMMSVF